MSQYSNIIDIYDNLVSVSDILHERNDTDIKGFDKALYILHHALKKFEGVNLHIENRNLKTQLTEYRATYNFDPPGIFELKKQIRALQNKINKLENEKINFESVHGIATSEMKLAEIDFEGKPIKFYVNTDQNEFTYHIKGANLFVYTLRDKKKKPVRSEIIKQWYMQYYREQGFKCISTN